MQRLLHVAPEQWVLKGALALEFRIGARSRSTLDVDLAGWDKPDDVTAVLLAAQSRNAEDFFQLRVDRIDREPGWDTIRYRILVELAGREFETIGVDVGVSDPQLWPPQSRSSPGLLEFGGIPARMIPVQAPEQQVAEKLHAYTRVYLDARRSSRTKDLIDLCLIARNESLEADRLNQAIAVTFQWRRTQEVPVQFPEPPEWWERQFAALAKEVGSHLISHQRIDSSHPCWILFWRVGVWAHGIRRGRAGWSDAEALRNGRTRGRKNWE